MLLYELLTGSTPLSSKRMKEAAYAEILRLIKEEEPPKPSTRLSDSGEALASISAQRHTEPAKLTKLMRGELDWIVMKTLEKDRNRRYETANGFAADVQRYLDDEPVLACPPSSAYRMRKFARQNRDSLIVGVLLALSLLVTVAGVTTGVGWAMRDRAARDEQEVREFAARQAKVSGQLQLILDEVARLAQAEKWSESLLSARRAQPLLAGDEVAADIRERVRKTLAELEFVQRLDDIRAEGGSVWGDPPPDQMAVADRNYAHAFREFGVDLDALPLDEAVDRIKSCRSILPAVKTAIDDWVAVRNLSKDGTEFRRLVAVIDVVDPDRWRQSLRSALASKDWAAVHRLAASAELDRQSAATLYVLGAALHGTGEYLLEIEVLRRAQWKYPSDYWINHRLGVSLIWSRSPDRVAEGIGYLRAAVALRPESSHAIMNLGNGHQFVGRYDEAAACYRRAVELNPKSAHSQLNLGNALSKLGKLDEASAAYHKAVEIDPKSASAHTALGTALGINSQPDEAIAAYRKALEFEPNLAVAHTCLGNALSEQKPSSSNQLFPQPTTISATR